MYANYIIEDNTVYEIDEECIQSNNKCLQQLSREEVEQEQLTFSAYI